jgi:hypothetical protein
LLHVYRKFYSWVYIPKKGNQYVEAVSELLHSFIAALFTISKTMETAKVARRHNGILFGHQKNEILPFEATWIEQEITLLSEISQVQKDKYCRISF